MKRYLSTTMPLFIIAAAISQPLLAQTKVGYRIKIGSKAKVTKVIEAKDCKTTIKMGTEVKEETVKVIDGTTYTITNKKIAPKDSVLLFPKKIKKELSGDAEGLANVYIDEKDKSILHINYWLNPEHTISKNTTIKRTIKTLGCDEKYTAKITNDTLKSDTTYRLWKISVKEWPNFKDKKWVETADEIIEVLDQQNQTSYYLVNRYDRDADYQMTLKNREFISYPTSWIEYGPITIPIKYRFQRTKNGKIAKDQFQSDLSIGIYGGYNFGKYRLRNDGGTLTELSPISFSVGGFLNVGTASIDKGATSLSDTPLGDDETSSIGVFSPGMGAMFSIHNLQIGLYSGIDFGMGKSAKLWNFNNRLWIGFGVAYNISGFWKK